MIDDDDFVVEAASEYLMRYGYDVHTAREFSAAKSLLMTRYFNVVLMDLHLTAGTAADGVRMVRWVREQFPSTHIGILTEPAASGVEDAVRSIGVTSFIQKPATLKHILTAVHALSASAADPV
ncbi:MAG TPA: response regulator [Thermoanaerobaculia bacterium]